MMQGRRQLLVITVMAFCALWAPAAFAQFTVTDGAGKPVLLVTKATTKYEVSGASGALGSLKVEGGKVNIYDAKGAKVGSVKKSGGDFTLDDATGKKIAKMSSKEDGFRVKDASDTILIKIKPRDGDFKVGDDAGKSLAKVKKKGDMILLSSEQGATLFKVSGKARADATGVLIVKRFSDLQKAALVLAVSQL
jgi:uncharacterized protein YxjI